MEILGGFGIVLFGVYLFRMFHFPRKLSNLRSNGFYNGNSVGLHVWLLIPIVIGLVTSHNLYIGMGDYNLAIAIVCYVVVWIFVYPIVVKVREASTLNFRYWFRDLSVVTSVWNFEIDESEYTNNKVTTVILGLRKKKIRLIVKRLNKYVELVELRDSLNYIGKSIEDSELSYKYLDLNDDIQELKNQLRVDGEYIKKVFGLTKRFDIEEVVVLSDDDRENLTKLDKMY